MFWAKLGIIASLIIGVALFVRDYTVTKTANKELSARVSQADDVSAILGSALGRSRELNAKHRAQFEELRNVQDDGTCDSPAIDWVFDRLREGAGARSEGAAGGASTSTTP